MGTFQSLDSGSGRRLRLALANAHLMEAMWVAKPVFEQSLVNMPASHAQEPLDKAHLLYTELLPAYDTDRVLSKFGKVYRFSILAGLAIISHMRCCAPAANKFWEDALETTKTWDWRPGYAEMIVMYSQSELAYRTGNQVRGSILKQQARTLYERTGRQYYFTGLGSIWPELAGFFSASRLENSYILAPVQDIVGCICSRSHGKAFMLRRQKKSKCTGNSVSPAPAQWRGLMSELGHTEAHLNGLNVIHVAGTKGKGSTCAFIESFLRVRGERTGFPRKTGLYTSPHLISPEERIRINFQLLSKTLFAHYLWEVLVALSIRSSDESTCTPRYLQLFALLSFHVFIREGVDVGVYETHHGSEYDATNIVKQPIVTAVTCIGEDHIDQLGPSIENIAWHKAGIFKPGALAFSAPQEAVVTRVLQARAAEKKVDLQFIGIDPSLPDNIEQLKLEVQRTNCSLARAVSDAFLSQKASAHSRLTLHDLLRGVNQFSWIGRFHLIKDTNRDWFLDGAHNTLSITKATVWFASEANKLDGDPDSVTRIIIFAHISEHQQGLDILKPLATSLQDSKLYMHHAIFTSYSKSAEDQCSPKPLSSYDTQYAEFWRSIYPNSQTWETPTIEKALGLAKQLGSQRKKMQTLITGSLHLVGGALSLLNDNATEVKV